MDPIGHPEPLFLLVPPRDAAPELVPEVAARVVADAIVPAGQLGILGDREGAAPTGTVRVVPTGPADRGPYELAHGDAFGSHLEQAGADIAHVGLVWNPGDDPAAKKAQAMAIARLAAWVHGSGRELLVDLEVPAVADDLEQVGGDQERFRAERHPELVVRAVQEIRDLGIEPDLWVLEPPATPDALQDLAAAVGDAGREQVGMLLADDTPEPLLRAATEVAGYRGVVLGRSVWTGRPEGSDTDVDPLAGTVEEVAGAIGRRVRAGTPGRGD